MRFCLISLTFVKKILTIWQVSTLYATFKEHVHISRAEIRLMLSKIIIRSWQKCTSPTEITFLTRDRKQQSNGKRIQWSVCYIKHPHPYSSTNKWGKLFGAYIGHLTKQLTMLQLGCTVQRFHIVSHGISTMPSNSIKWPDLIVWHVIQLIAVCEGHITTTTEQSSLAPHAPCGIALLYSVILFSRSQFAIKYSQYSCPHFPLTRAIQL